MTIPIDHNHGSARVIGCENGCTKESVTQFTEYFKEKHGNPQKIRMVTCDMSAGYLSAMHTEYPQAKMVIDKFHVIKHMNETVDDVRRREIRVKHQLKGTWYI